MSHKIEELNKRYKAEYESNESLELFTKYVMSETIAPIEDYENVVNLIRQNYHKYISVELLMVGAYSAIMWTHSDNEMLEMLNLMKSYLPNRERAIVHYLNAYKIYTLDKEYLTNLDYLAELRASLAYDVTFVNNRLHIAKLSTIEDAKKYYAEAISNVQKVFSENQIIEYTVEHFLDPQTFINEFILGLNMSIERYNEIKKKVV